jgi:hypothetical protein
MTSMELGIGSRIEHPTLGRGVVVDIGSEFNNIWFKSSNIVRSIGKNFEGLRVLSSVESTEIGGMVNMADLEFVLHKILEVILVRKYH